MYDYVWVVRVGPAGVYAMGEFADVVDFGMGGVGPAGSTFWGGVASYTSSGAPRWAKYLEEGELWDIETIAGKLWGVGGFSNTFSLGPMPLTSAGGNDLLMLELDGT